MFVLQLPFRKAVGLLCLCYSCPLEKLSDCCVCVGKLSDNVCFRFAGHAQHAAGGKQPLESLLLQVHHLDCARSIPVLMQQDREQNNDHRTQCCCHAPNICFTMFNPRNRKREQLHLTSSVSCRERQVSPCPSLMVKSSSPCVEMAPRAAQLVVSRQHCWGN